MANKQARTHGNAKEVRIEQPGLREHAHPARGFKLSMTDIQTIASVCP